MLTKTDLQSLRKYRAISGMVLSLYVNQDQSNAANLNRGFERSVDSALRAACPTIEGDRRLEFEACAERARKFLGKHRPQSLSLVLFIRPTGSLWCRELDVPLATEVHWSEGAYVQPFVEA